VTVAQDLIAPLNLTFTLTGTVSVQVSYKNGTAAASAQIYIRDAAAQSFSFAGKFWST